ncbi:hypothetical protein [Acetobacter pasteurianus]|uniref:Uncharacterized protein n=1 Tax=Acetobacter pasteurianus NBRC 3188 TaxID=1226663 RepID=A0A401WUH9_ACEPA|nr:hypothetical protein [Acetobacter pasteurianus]GCD53009.1 hypothetical protein NBRC3188_1706 [Acetobacter pasteurianus NBRC 3188]
MTTKKEQALRELDKTYAEFKAHIQSAPQDANFSLAAVMNVIENKGYRPAISVSGNNPGDIVLAAATIFGFASGFYPTFKNPDDFRATMNAGIQCGQGEFPEEAAPCSTTKH